MRLWSHGARMRAGAAVDRLAETMFRLRGPRRIPLREAGTVRLGGVDASIAKGVRYLSACRTSGGMVRGFLLPPGASTTWLTAHVAYVLEGVPESEPFCGLAASALADVGLSDGGWGYNRRVGVDTDSTAQAIMVLDRFGIPAPAFVVDALANTQEPTGGFPTYAPPQRGIAPTHGWQRPHPDVSAMVAEALRRLGGFERQVERCAGWLRTQLVGGILPSYWWNGQYYGLWLQSRTPTVPVASAETARVLLRRSYGAGIPQVAMALAATTRLCPEDGFLDAAVADLLLAQRTDGSWPCSPCLRVTSPRVTSAAFVAPGMVVADRRRVFSTAHCVSALSDYRALTLGWSARRGQAPVNSPQPGVRVGVVAQ